MMETFDGMWAGSVKVPIPPDFREPDFFDGAKFPPPIPAIPRQVEES